MLDITFTDETEKMDLSHVNLVKDILVFATDYLKLQGENNISVTIVSDEKIREINRDYRDKDRVTDVISFALQDAVEGEMERFGFDDLPTELGDLFISLDTAKCQAKDYGHSVEREVGFLALHGFLHLNGYDHMTEEEEKVMFGLQKEILDAYGLKRN